ncbi:hypothetical protein PR202_ga24260 [Eleusine coracana subsp. coracana]|uniref:Late embryogenesis abundant protein LEA-2 subgroup domain-containing protein n=1 Tax=Eleusine coracana subsp. coracana TaxID=191504 RepID=A0AAV5D7F0_ELECO|nr:hypothetical protein QOZ80_1BG0049420 [Eleusine coracana subsp. coracana]GJN06527.1 hypothetical protein PR202_ga24260 [Eleusine coracana subsp. coracana]
MKHTTSESDVTSLSASSPPRTPKSPKRPAYYVQSPSHDDGDKSSTSHTTPVYNNSPLESPSHPSTGRHSRISSATRYSGFLRSSSPASRKRLNNSSAKGWREIDAIDEESAGYDELEEEEPKFCVMAFWFSVLVLVFTMVCLIVWGAARHYKPTVIVKSLTVHNFYVGEGTDRTGVPTKLVTLNCSLHINVHNPSTMFGIHVSSSSSRLMYSEISIADGQFNKFYQPRTSTRVASVVLHGDKTPLYGAGATLDLSNTGGAVPLTLELAVRTRGYVIGKLVRVSHAKHVKCPVAIQSGSSKPIRFRQSACSYT